MFRLLKNIRSKYIIIIFCLLAFNGVVGQKTYVHKDSGHSDKSKKNKTEVTEENNLVNNIGWQVGLGFGLYLPGNASANYYNGSGINSLHRIIIDNIYNYQALKERLNYDFVLDSNNLPNNMKYNPGIVLQAVSKYNFNENNGFVVDVGYSKLTASDYFTLILNNPNNMTSEPTVQLGKIWGIEERVNINVGYIRTFGKPKRVKPFFELGFNINDTKLKDNTAQVLNLSYSIVDPTQSYYGYKQGGIGHGFYSAGGFIFNIGDAFAAHVGANFSMKKINLLTDPKYSKEWVFFVRLMYKNLFGGNNSKA